MEALSDPILQLFQTAVDKYSRNSITPDSALYTEFVKRQTQTQDEDEMQDQPQIFSIKVFDPIKSQQESTYMKDVYYYEICTIERGGIKQSVNRRYSDFKLLQQYFRFKRAKDVLFFQIPSQTSLIQFVTRSNQNQSRVFGFNQLLNYLKEVKEIENDHFWTQFYRNSSKFMEITQNGYFKETLDSIKEMETNFEVSCKQITVNEDLSLKFEAFMIYQSRIVQRLDLYSLLSQTLLTKKQQTYKGDVANVNQDIIALINDPSQISGVQTILEAIDLSKQSLEFLKKSLKEYEDHLKKIQYLPRLDEKSIKFAQHMEQSLIEQLSLFNKYSQNFIMNQRKELKSLQGLQ